jgi:hypothetical protein
VATVVGDNCDNGNDGSGVDGSGDDANATAAVAAMATAMAAARGQRQRQQQRWRGGEIKQSTKKGTTETAMATEMVTVTNSDGNIAEPTTAH